MKEKKGKKEVFLSFTVHFHGGRRQRQAEKRMERKTIVSDCFVMVIIIFVTENIHESCFGIEAGPTRPT